MSAADCRLFLSSQRTNAAGLEQVRPTLTSQLAPAFLSVDLFLALSVQGSLVPWLVCAVLTLTHTCLESLDLWVSGYIIIYLDGTHSCSDVTIKVRAK